MSEERKMRLKNFAPDTLVFSNQRITLTADILLAAGLLLAAAGFILQGHSERRFVSDQKETIEGYQKLYEFAANAAGGNI